ncbi:MAG TPA: carboxypeptidase-like regulatory domain-containing protein [Candidatus Acidoferrales bacterium]|nr:carboxypeptidase-like regulatory domain-containing protein [Candidatus Acidoferrales bacterium]
MKLLRFLPRDVRNLGPGIVVCLFAAASAMATPPTSRATGALSGIVFDVGGTPQMGATVLLVGESTRATPAIQLLTDPHGVFSGERLTPGYYTVRVTLAGFLPTIERHVRVAAHLTTLVKIELDSVFASLDRLRRQPDKPTDPDDWKWVLRTASGMRPVLQWGEGNDTSAVQDATLIEEGRHRVPRGRLELTSGGRRPGSVSNLADSPGTAFAYDQKVGNVSRLLLAGQMSYEHTAAAGIATVWLPSGNLGTGPQTALVIRQSKLGPGGLTFRSMRMDQSGKIGLGDRFVLQYGAEYMLAGLAHSTSAVRPRGELDARLSRNWRAIMIVAAESSTPMSTSMDDERAELLQSALNQLDAFPVVLWRSGRPVLEGGWHKELAVEHNVSKRATVEVSGFRDDSRHVAIFGRGMAANPDYFQDFFSDVFAYDGGPSNSWGTRVAFKEKVSDGFEFSAVYAYAGALSLGDAASASDLRGALQTRYRSSLAGRASGRVPGLGTRMMVSYKFVDGPVVSHQDLFGESQNGIDPYLHVSIRQPLPHALFLGRVQALADLQNLLAQGYVAMASRDGRATLLPATRSFRGGLSFQF